MKDVYIVTGAGGFLGNNIIRKLVKISNAEIRALILPESNNKALENIPCKIYRGDVTKIDTLKDIFTIEQDINLYVIHCAAIVSIKSKKDDNIYNVNVNGTKNIIKKVLENNAKLVYINTVHAITEKENNQLISETTNFEPENVKGYYAKTKAETAKYVLQKVKKENLNACILHPSGIIGPNDFSGTHLTQLLIDFANDKLTACVNGGYNFVDVRDVADCAINACENGEKGECYIISNKYIKIKELLDIEAEIINKKKIKVILPMWFAKLTASISEIYYNLLKQPPLYTKYSLYTITSNSNFSNKKAKEKLNLKNREIEETIKDTINWLKENKKIRN